MGRRSRLLRVHRAVHLHSHWRHCACLLVCRLDSCHLLPVEVKQLSGGREGGSEGYDGGRWERLRPKKVSQNDISMDFDIPAGICVWLTSRLEQRRATVAACPLHTASPRLVLLVATRRLPSSVSASVQSVSAPADRPFIHHQSIKHQTSNKH